MTLVSRIFTFIALFVSASAFGQSALIPNTLFRVEGPNTVSYLFGTLHVGVGLREFPIAVTRMIEGARVVLPELEYTLEDTLRFTYDPITVFMSQLEFQPPFIDGETLHNVLQMGVPPMLAEKLSDSDCNALSAIVYLRWPISLDMDVIRVARLKGVPVTALDNPDLRRRARAESNRVNGSCSIREQFASYSPAQLAALTMKGVSDQAADYRTGSWSIQEADGPLAVYRNQAWLPAILGELKTGRAFISVGQLHLLGPHGLIALLRANGYVVIPVYSL